MKTGRYKIETELWVYPGPAPWHFVTVGREESREIKERYGKVRRGFGSIPVEVTIGETSWKTSIFPNSKDGTYLLPIKALVRKKENIYEGDIITVALAFD